MIWVYAGEKPLLEAFTDEDKAGAIVIHALAATPASVKEDEEVPRKGVYFDDVFDAQEEAIVTGPHVRGLLAEVDLRPSIESDHAADFFRNSSR